MSDRRILFLSPRQCWPPQGGAKLREYHFLRALAETARVTYVYFADEGVNSVRQNLGFCEAIIGVPKPRANTFLKLFRGAAGRWPLSVLNNDSAPMAAALANLKGPFDLIHMDVLQMIRYSEAALRAAGGKSRVAYNWHNIESELMRRYAAAAGSAPRRMYAKQTEAKLARLEKEILRTAFGHVVCSEREREELLQAAPNARIVTVENGVDTDYFEGLWEAKGPRRRILFVGKMNYYPNINAAQHLVEKIWPTVRQRMPAMTLTLVGSEPVDAVKALNNAEGVEVTGTVADLRPYYREAVASIVPLRMGGGTRLKILEAMAARVPVISTKLGAEGLDVEEGRELLFADADRPEEWASKLERLACVPEEYAAMTARARDLVRARYDWSIVDEIVRRTYEEWLGAAA